MRVLPSDRLSLGPQSRQSAKLFLQSSELGLTHPHPQASVPPPSFGSVREGHTRLRERGGGVPILTRGHTLWYSFYIRTLWLGQCLLVYQFYYNLLLLFF
jgi:hypothetical protein